MQMTDSAGNPTQTNTSSYEPVDSTEVRRPASVEKYETGQPQYSPANVRSYASDTKLNDGSAL